MSNKVRFRKKLYTAFLIVSLLFGLLPGMTVEVSADSTDEGYYVLMNIPYSEFYKLTDFTGTTVNGNPAYYHTSNALRELTNDSTALALLKSEGASKGCYYNKEATNDEDASFIKGVTCLVRFNSASDYSLYSDQYKNMNTNSKVSLYEHGNYYSSKEFECKKEGVVGSQDWSDKWDGKRVYLIVKIIKGSSETSANGISFDTKLTVKENKTYYLTDQKHYTYVIDPDTSNYSTAGSYNNQYYIKINDSAQGIDTVKDSIVYGATVDWEYTGPNGRPITLHSAMRHYRNIISNTEIAFSTEDSKVVKDDYTERYTIDGNIIRSVTYYTSKGVFKYYLNTSEANTSEGGLYAAKANESNVKCTYSTTTNALTVTGLPYDSSDVSLDNRTNVEAADFSITYKNAAGKNVTVTRKGQIVSNGTVVLSDIATDTNSNGKKYIPCSATIGIEIKSYSSTTCNERNYFKITKNVDVVQHDYQVQSGDYDWYDNYKSCKVHVRCTNCNQEETAYLTVTSKVVIAPTTIAEGTTEYNAEGYTNDEHLLRATKRIVDIPKLEKSTQTVTVEQKTYSKKVGDDYFQIIATTNGDGKITYKSSNEAVCLTDKKGVITVKAVGSCDIEISAEETDLYKASDVVKVTITVAEADAKKKSKKTSDTTKTAKAGQEVTTSTKGTFKVVSADDMTVSYVAPTSKAKKITVPSTIKDASGNTYTVTTIKNGAFKNTTATTVVLPKTINKISSSAFKQCKVKTVTIKSTTLKKASVKSCFAGSKVKTVVVPKKKLKAYKKIFTRSIVGRSVTVKK